MYSYQIITVFLSNCHFDICGDKWTNSYKWDHVFFVLLRIFYVWIFSSSMIAFNHLGTSTTFQDVFFPKLLSTSFIPTEIFIYFSVKPVEYWVAACAASGRSLLSTDQPSPTRTVSISFKLIVLRPKVWIIFTESSEL